MIYLDWAASAIPYTDEIEAAYREATAVFANPSAQHRFGKEAREMLEKARSRCAAVLGVPAETLYFTSGASESNSLVLLSLLTRPVTGSLVISNIEHPSVREQAAVLEHCGWTVLTAPSGKNGCVTPDAVLQTLREDTMLVAIMGVNNEIGSIQPVKSIAQALKTHTAGKRPIHFHVDMVQSIGKLPIAELGLADVHSASMSAHKIGGPRGIGLLYLKQPVSSGIRGGSQERNIRPGTENLAGACALARCLEKTYTDFQQKFERAGELSRFLLEALSQIPECSIIPAARVPAPSVPNETNCAYAFSPWIIQVGFANVPAEIMTRCLSDREIFVSAGSACSSKKKVRPILAALSVSPEIAQNAIRISIGHSTEKSDLEQFISAVKEIIKDFN
ncbi:cysteine desulfurase family protein [Treponema sp. OMZ 855]|uniref:cysteine desulfurase family protein n=1 Tax=Treponema sp. OMZ 855 TaxID=1643512 RepID=UPI0020A50536|nr:cysteine desulfurase family protein [Treponema sp. OMZ 855]UTC51743.1 cysteine desulfurase [Treponema sp. OMZ 855]